MSYLISGMGSNNKFCTSAPGYSGVTDGDSATVPNRSATQHSD